MDSERRFVIIGGTNRAGTTSLFQYLGAHSDVRISEYKETRFFLDQDYPAPVNYRYSDEPLEKYYSLFGSGAGSVCVEASPDYLYSPGTPRRVMEALGAVKWIFVLREPVDRLLSWYHFGKQTGLLPTEISLEEYIARLLDAAARPGRELIYRTLEQGRYSNYLPAYYETFGEENVLLLPFGLLHHEPFAFMERACRFIGIDPECYRQFEFAATNASHAYKRQGFHRIYSAVMHGGAMQRLYFYAYNKPAIRKSLHFLRTSVIEPVYLQLNMTKKEDGLPAELRSRLQHYYAGELQRLENLSGSKLSWDHVV